MESIKHNLIYEAGLNLVVNDALKKLTPDCANARCIRARLEEQLDFHVRFNETWPMWEFGNPYSERIATRIGGDREHVELMTLLLLLMPGRGRVGVGVGVRVGAIGTWVCFRVLTDRTTILNEAWSYLYQNF